MAYDLKLYFEQETVNTRITAHADWEQVGVDYRPSLTTSKASTTIAAQVRTPTCTTSPWDVFVQQFSSAATGAHEWTTSDTFDCVFIGYENNDALNASLYISIRVLDSTLTTVRGTLYSGNVNNSELTSATYAQRHADLVPIQNAVSQSSTDVIVIEVGSRCLCTTGTYQTKWYFGTSSVTDLGLVDQTTLTPTTACPWIGFTWAAVTTATNPQYMKFIT